MKVVRRKFFTSHFWSLCAVLARGLNSQNGQEEKGNIA